MGQTEREGRQCHRKIRMAVGRAAALAEALVQVMNLTALSAQQFALERGILPEADGPAPAVRCLMASRRSLFQQRRIQLRDGRFPGQISLCKLL
ncbi:hypothetical protein D3C79_970810 [compost metagenome]